MNQIIKYLFFLALIYSLSCNTNRELVLKIQLDNGSYAYLPYNIFRGDTIITGIAKYYSKSGILTDEIEFKNSKKNGWHKSFNAGRLISKVMYVKDSANGNAFFYGPNSKITQEVLYKNNKKLLVQEIDTAGNINVVNFIDEKGIAFFAYNYSNNVISKNGSLVSNNLISNANLNAIPANEEINFKIQTVILPEFVTNIQVALFDSNFNLLIVKNNASNDGYFSSFNINFTQTGKHKLGIAAELLNRNRQVIKRDTIYHEIYVINKY